MKGRREAGKTGGEAGPVRPAKRKPDAATESTGPAERGANPDDGWQEWPAGHREGRAADDDMVRRKG